MKRKIGKITHFIQSQSPEGAVVGISGGVDSAVTAALCARALGPGSVLGVFMPSNETAHEDKRHFLETVRWLGIDARVVDISELVASLEQACGKGTDDKTVLGNLRPRLRMSILYYFANLMNRKVAGTGNKSELTVGYFTKHGDGACDFLPIGGLLKTEVFEIAKELGVPKDIIGKKPSAGLWKGQTDEAELGMSYAELDKQLMSLTPEKSVLKMFEKAVHKLHMPPICEV